LNTILETDFYIYREVDTDDTTELIRRVRVDHLEDYVPILAIWQPANSETRLNGYPLLEDELRHYLPIFECDGIDPDTAMIGYCDPISGWGGVYVLVPSKSTISAETMSWLNSGGSIIY
jgi:hypothetical protein